jgi:hypothetical protein
MISHETSTSACRKTDLGGCFGRGWFLSGFGGIRLRGRLGWIRLLRCWLRGRTWGVSVVHTMATNACYDVCLARNKSVFVCCWSLVVSVEAYILTFQMHTASDTARSDEPKTQKLMSCMMTCFSDRVSGVAQVGMLIAIR